MVEVPRIRSNVAKVRLVNVSVLPVVKVAFPVRVKSTSPVRVPADVSRLFPNTKVLPVRSSASAVPPAVNVEPPVNVSVLAPTVIDPPSGFQALVTVRSVVASRVRVYVETSRAKRLTGTPAVIVASPVRVRLVVAVVVSFPQKYPYWRQEPGYCL